MVCDPECVTTNIACFVCLSDAHRSDVGVDSDTEDDSEPYYNGEAAANHQGPLDLRMDHVQYEDAVQIVDGHDYDYYQALQGTPHCIASRSTTARLFAHRDGVRCRGTTQCRVKPIGCG